MFPELASPDEASVSLLLVEVAFPEVPPVVVPVAVESRCCPRSRWRWSCPRRPRCYPRWPCPGPGPGEPNPAEVLIPASPGHPGAGSARRSGGTWPPPSCPSRSTRRCSPRPDRCSRCCPSWCCRWCWPPRTGRPTPNSTWCSPNRTGPRCRTARSGNRAGGGPSRIGGTGRTGVTRPGLLAPGSGGVVVLLAAPVVSTLAPVVSTLAVDGLAYWEPPGARPEWLGAGPSAPEAREREHPGVPRLPRVPGVARAT